MSAPETLAAARALGDNSVLGVLPAPVRERLARAGAPLRLEAGATLCQAGDPGDALYVVIEGEIEVLNRTAGGRQLRLAAIGAGSVCGEMAALDGGLRSAEMLASRRCLLWRIPRGALIETLASDSGAALALVAELTRRLRASNALLETSALLNLGARLAKLLLEEAGARGVVQLTQTELARRIGASREKVNRKLHAWAADHWVETTPAGVRLLQPSALRELVARAQSL